ncbi:hypothetical protein EAH89_25485 [Roseomonas nepalensis]|uniref:DotA/TraY family protein n=1 Tax=Muricoccus nepalensis TaxID=1854500 RepID=A0A502F9A6_9PROT|nr:DotA/TraY family protein [Roseomonas nepalensis]TPG45978.1 hypothetical protein EAH89_25485 [Roseomonas nepalensis]
MFNNIPGLPAYDPANPEPFLLFIRGLFNFPLIGQLALYLNAAALMAFSLLAVYATVSGVISSASKGQVLGEQGRVAWVPVRLLFAAVLLVPTGNGWSVGQVAVIQVAEEGVQLASRIWAKLQMQVPRQVAASAVGRLSDDQARQVVWDDLENAICRYEYVKMTRRSLQLQTTDRRSAYYYQEPGGWFASGTTRYPCGEVNFPVADATTAPGLQVLINAQRDTYFRSVAGQIDAIAKARVTGGDPDNLFSAGPLDYAAVEQVVQTYAAALRDLVRLVPDSSPVTTSWTLAGSRWNEMARSAAAIRNGALSLPTHRLVSWDKLAAETEARTAVRAPLISRVEGHRKALADGRAMGAGATGQASTIIMSSPSSAASAPAQQTETAEGLLDKVLGWAADQVKAVTDVYLSIRASLPDMALSVVGAGTPGASPVQVLVNTGHTMLFVGLTGVALADGSEHGLLSSIPGVGNAIGAISGVLKPLMWAMTTTGFTLAYILPLTPFSVWITSVVSYLVLVWTTILAVPVVALSHVKLEGDGWIPSAAAAGWVAVLRIGLTPVMMLVSLIVGYTVVEFSAAILLQGFIPVFTDVSAGQRFVFIGWIIAGIVLTFLLLSIFWMCFSLISSLSESVLMLALGSAGNIRPEGHGQNTHLRLPNLPAVGRPLTRPAGNFPKRPSISPGISPSGGAPGASQQRR